MEYQEFIARNNENKARYSQQKKLVSQNCTMIEKYSWRIDRVDRDRGAGYVLLVNNVTHQESYQDIISMVKNIFTSPMLHVSNPSALKSWAWNRI